MVGATLTLVLASTVGARPADAGPKSVGETTDPVSRFMETRGQAPLWFSRSSGEAAQRLLSLLGTADLDGISKDEFEIGSILIAIRRASSGDPAAVRHADLMLSRAFVAYAQELQRDPKVGVVYVDPELKPKPTPAAVLLANAAKAPSLEKHIHELRWMNPLYGQLRQALVHRFYAMPRERHVLMLNLQRARALPPASQRYVLVNTANQRLYMYENGEIVDEMRVVAGRANAQTPLMNAYIRFAVLNPYWHVPADLTARLAPNVLRRGKSYLDIQGYEAVADFSDNPQVLDPEKLDWAAIAAGKLSVQLRQKPGPANSMGLVKFMFPNSQGIWLHDTPSREHLSKDVRLASAGCVRLEDPWRLGSWLFQHPLKPITGAPEQRVDLPELVPVYITYLTAVPQGSAVTLIQDVYRRDLSPLHQVETDVRPVSPEQRPAALIMPVSPPALPSAAGHTYPATQ